MMFRRKSSDEAVGVETPHGAAAAPNGSAAASSESAVRPAARPDKILSAALKAGPTPPVRAGVDLYRRAVDLAALHQKSAGSPMPTESKKLTVGRDISLNGRISSCDRLVVEGRVEAELNDCHTVEIAETGTFKGAAEIESAEISGHYEGSLTVREHLVIRRTGQVSGTVRYGQLEIEQGGEINGDVTSLNGKPENPARAHEA